MSMPSLPHSRRPSGTVMAADVIRPLTAWLYDLDDQSLYYKKSKPVTAKVDRRLHVAATAAGDGVMLPLSPRVGMALEPIVFQADQLSHNWIVRNNGHTNTLRIQPWGLRPFPLRPQTESAMPGTDVAIWIPVVSPGCDPRDRGETFRVVIAHTDVPPAIGMTPDITGPKIRQYSKEQMEALLYYFGEYFDWPPHPAPHVRSTAELNSTVAAPDPRFVGAKGRLIDPHALFRTSKSGERDWFPPSGRPGAVEAYLPAVERMVEVGSLNLSLVWRWRNQLGLGDYVSIDDELVHPRIPRFR